MEKLFMYAVIVAILCITGLIGQCSQRISNCQTEAIKAGKDVEKVVVACRQA